MATNPTNDVSKNQIANLPQDLRDAIFSTDSVNKITAIGQKYNLTIDKIGELDDETLNVMEGVTRPADYIANLQKRLGADFETAKKIAQEINEQIFGPIKESLKKIHGVGPEKEESGFFDREPKTPKVQPAPKSPFEQKLEQKVFRPSDAALEKEIAEAQKERRYPSEADPYKEPINKNEAI